MTTDRAEPQQPSLKPCPCGNKANTAEGPYSIESSIDRDRTMWRLDCQTEGPDAFHDDCGWCVIAPTRQQCLIDWNRRASPAPDPAQEAAPVALRDALISCARMFRMYVDIHAKKGHEAKAARNREMVELCDRALASPPAAPVANGTEGKSFRRFIEEWFGPRSDDTYKLWDAMDNRFPAATDTPASAIADERCPLIRPLSDKRCTLAVGHLCACMYDDQKFRQLSDAPPPIARSADAPTSWTEIRKSFVSMMAQIDQRFRSGNTTPVERAHITADEWALMERYEEANEDLVTTVLSRESAAPAGSQQSGSGEATVLTRSDLIGIAKLALIEMEKISKIFDAAIAKCEAQNSPPASGELK